MTTHTDTSIQSYHEEEDTGRLAGKRALVARMYEQHGPGTTREILTRLGGNLNLWRARATELQLDGTLLHVDTRPCKLSGKSCEVLQWVPEGQRVPIQRIDPRDQVIETLCSMLEEFLSGGVVAEDDARRAITDARALCKPRQ